MVMTVLSFQHWQWTNHVEVCSPPFCLSRSTYPWLLQGRFSPHSAPTHLDLSLFSFSPPSSLSSSSFPPPLAGSSGQVYLSAGRSLCISNMGQLLVHPFVSKLIPHFRSDGLPPYASVSLPPLTPNQKYDISVDLELPYTQSNSALGNFMTTLTLLTPNNKTLAYVRRPVSVYLF